MYNNSNIFNYVRIKYFRKASIITTNGETTTQYSLYYQKTKSKTTHIVCSINMDKKQQKQFLKTLFPKIQKKQIYENADGTVGSFSINKEYLVKRIKELTRNDIEIQESYELLGFKDIEYYLDITDHINQACNRN